MLAPRPPPPTPRIVFVESTSQNGGVGYERLGLVYGVLLETLYLVHCVNIVAIMEWQPGSCGAAGIFRTILWLVIDRHTEE